MTVNDKKTHECSISQALLCVEPRPCVSKEGRPERVPSAGNGNGTSLNNSGSNGNYWSSVPNSDSNNAYELNFNSSNHNLNNNNRNYGQSVRPVPGFTSDCVDGVPYCNLELLSDLIVAYRDARRHKRGRTYQTNFEMNQERELVQLRDELSERCYKARPSSCFIIHEPKMREVFAAEFRDRVVHHLFYNYTHELFERTFISDSYSCIEGRGTHYGVNRLRKHILSCSKNWSKPCYVLKLDIKGYFMGINRALLLKRCREILKKQRGKVRDLDWDLIDYLLESICLLNPIENCRVLGDRNEWGKLPKEKSLFYSKSGCGLPIGNLSSQLFSNVYLGVLDDFMKRDLKCQRYGRYVDDMFVVSSSKEELYSIVPKVRSFLRKKLELEINEAKVRVVDAYKGVEFLGAFVKPYRTYPSMRSLRRMRGRMKALDLREKSDCIQARVNSMMGVLSHYDCYQMRKVLIHQSRLRKFGDISDDCLRFYPDKLKL